MHVRLRGSGGGIFEQCFLLSSLKLLLKRSRDASEPLTRNASATVEARQRDIGAQRLGNCYAASITDRVVLKVKGCQRAVDGERRADHLGSLVADLVIVEDQFCQRAHDGQEARQHQPPRHTQTAVVEVERDPAIGFLAKALHRETNNHAAARRRDSYSE
eukprot:scaffold20470_cov63-Phaeocystis_antarctica.AAC.1